MKYSGYFAIMSKGRHDEAVAYNFWKMCFLLKLDVAETFEMRTWDSDEEALELGEKWGNNIENTTTQERVYRGEISTAFKESIVTDIFNAQNILKCFTINLIKEEQTIFYSEHYGTALIISDLSLEEKNYFETMDIEKHYPEVDYYHINHEMKHFEIRDSSDIVKLMERFDYFHDSCIKEIYYDSSAYVQGDYQMKPNRDNPSITILFQAQNHTCPAIEIQFYHVVGGNLNALITNKGALIVGATMKFIDEVIYWADCETWENKNVQNDETIWVAAKMVEYTLLEEGGLGWGNHYAYRAIEY